MRKLFLSFAAFFLASGLEAGTWIEKGDAGNNIFGAQVVYGSGPLNQIQGHINAPGDSTPWVDVYKILVSDPKTFSAFTSGQIPDPALFLFSIDGYGFEGGRDISSTNKQGFLIGDPSGDTPPQAVYLWISAQDKEPGCASRPMFGGGGTEYPYAAGPLGPPCRLTGPIGNASPANMAGSNYAYTITLTGANFVPEPASFCLVPLGLLALAARRRRR